jgi:hypothetical protein
MSNPGGVKYPLERMSLKRISAKMMSGKRRGAMK